MYYGVQYYRPLFPREEFWEQDFQNIKELGFNIVKLWAVWNDIEREEGQFVFDDLDAQVRLAEKYGLKVIINTIVEGAPYWIYEKYPDALYESVCGDKVTPGGPANIPTGGWPGLCMDHPGAAEMVSGFIRETAAHFRDFESVEIIDVWNEPHLEPMYDYPNDLLCACESSKKAFREWLKEQYQTLEKLNQVWYRRYTEWEQVVPPPRFGTYPDMIDWRRFWLYNLQRWLRIKTDAAREGAPGKLIQTHSASAGYMGAAGNGALGFELADEFLLAEPVDIFGLSSFPAWLMGNTREEYFLSHIMQLDFICAAANGKPFYQVELQGGAGKPEVLGHITPDRYDIRVWNWNVIASGGKGTVYWQYAFEPAGVESPGFGLTGFEHENTERSLEAGRCARYFQEKNLDGSESVPAVNGIYVSRNADLFLFAADRKEKMYAGSLSGIYKVCADAGIPVRMIHSTYLKQAWEEGLRVLYVPMSMALSKEEQEDILCFAKKGGTVVLEAAAGFYDEHGEMDVRRSILKEVFGASNFSIHYKRISKIVDNDGNIVCSADLYIQTMDISKGKELGTADDGKTGYAEVSYGEGLIRWIGAFPAMSADREENHPAITFVKNQFLRQGYHKLQDLKADGLIVRMLKTGKDYSIVAVNQHEEERTLEVEVDGKRTEMTVPGYDGIMISLD